MTAIESGMTITAAGMTIAAAAMTTEFVIAGLTRNPVHAYHWIPDQSLPRTRSGVRDDKMGHGMTN